jgi:hypothetical protein
MSGQSPPRRLWRAAAVLVGLASILAGAGYVLLLLVRLLWPPPSAEQVWSATVRFGDRSMASIGFLAAGPAACYVASSSAPQILRLDASGRVVGRWRANPGVRSGRLAGSPRALAVDPGGMVRVVVSSPPNSRTITEYLLTFSPDGKLIGKSTCDFMTDSVAVGSDGKTYLAGGASGLREVDARGRLVRRFGGSPLDIPTGGPPKPEIRGRLLGVSPDGGLYVLERDIVRQVRADGSTGWQVSGVENAAASPGGALYAVLRRGGAAGRGTRIVRYEASGRARGQWSCARVSPVAYMAADGQRQIYAADYFHEVTAYRLPGDARDPAPAPAQLAGREPAPAGALSPAIAVKRGRAILRRAFARLGAARSFQARISMTVVNYNFRSGATSDGSVAAMKPNFLRVEARSPAVGETFYVADGGYYYSQGFDLRGHPVIARSRLPRSIVSLPGLWEGEIDAFFGGAKCLSAGKALLTGSENVGGVDCDTVRVSFEDSNRTIDYAVGKRDFLIRRGVVESSNAYGIERHTNLLSEFRFNVPMSPARFAFRAPHNEKIVNSGALKP